MLKKILIKNFKPFSQTEPVRMAPITLIYGPNSAGKSSIIQSLIMMTQTINGQKSKVDSDLITKGSLVDLGNYASIIHRHETDKTLSFEYEFTQQDSSVKRSEEIVDIVKVTMNFMAGDNKGISSPTLSEYQFTARTTAGDIDIQVSKSGKTGISEVNLDGYDEKEELVAADLFELGPRTNFQQMLNYVTSRMNARGMSESKNLTKVFGSTLNTIKIKKGVDSIYARLLSSTPPYLPTNLAISRKDREIAMRGRDDKHWFYRGVEELLQRCDSRIRRELSNIIYLAPLRSYPSRYYFMEGTPNEYVGSRGEDVVPILFQSKSTGGERSSLIKKLNQCCKDFGIPYTFEVTNKGDPITGDVIVLTLKDTRTGVKVGPSDVGFGIGQLLPILVQGMILSEDSKGGASRIICVEQPEIHLHPRLQASMADFFINTAAKNNNIQWILETHSEALITRLQRRIREKKISSRDVSILYINPLGKKGSTIQELRLDEDGEFIDLWPDGFFVETFNDMMN
jgi:predicted ATPase